MQAIWVLYPIFIYASKIHTDIHYTGNECSFLSLSLQNKKAEVQWHFINSKPESFHASLLNYD